jgi:hypothetical protein
MSANLSRLRLFQRHLRCLVWVWVWVWDWIHWHTSPRTRSSSSLHPPFTHYSFSPRSLVCGGQPSPHKPRLVVSHSTCSPRSSSPHAHSFTRTNKRLCRSDSGRSGGNPDDDLRLGRRAHRLSSQGFPDAHVIGKPYTSKLTVSEAEA